jgi:ADP-dependent NAD(P)H-hydrate dehydratase / NAD(P)H-hydrate epimerase
MDWALGNENAVLTPDQMARADALAIQGGMSGARLMENAGQAVKSVVLAQYPGICRAPLIPP